MVAPNFGEIFKNQPLSGKFLPLFGQKCWQKMGFVSGRPPQIFSSRTLMNHTNITISVPNTSVISIKLLPVDDFYNGMGFSELMSCGWGFM